ncbi:hypothetical protein [Mangrovimonas spongiae]|uniref:Sulfotransferase domain-containing protein n=1 Tax=Mangrovimonas spongiae TaxID=2494697 RepID=A0A428K263_9FLAO|nr:hypothetical protein [Mangrovimonas spongiae]RSK40498.1 hypothetical protein EJA19_05850 [Mangrovimonas spongiae]
MGVKYIFCISTGRSGTAYLCKLLGALEKCQAFHEQKPILHHGIMRSYLAGKTAPLKHVMPNKVKHIKKHSESLYVDTSHIFIKSFGWELPKYIPEDEIGVVILKRDKEQVVESTQRVHSGPFTYTGRKWIITPYRLAIIKPPLSFLTYMFYRALFKGYEFVRGERNQIEKTYPKCIVKYSKKLLEWYYDETYALAEKYKAQYPNITYITVDLDGLNTIEGVEKIIQTFKLEHLYAKAKILPYLGQKTNLKLEY